MALPWVRIDTQWSHNPKFLMLTEDKRWRAIVVYMAALGYSGAHGTAGFIPAIALPMIHGTRREAQELAEVGLWVPAQGGWDVNGWAEFQPSAEEQQKRSQKARESAQARWAKEHARQRPKAIS